MQEHHAESALTDAATDGKGQRVAKQALVEVEFLALFFSLQGELTEQGFLVNTNAHRTEFNAAVQRRIPNKQVAVQPEEAALVGRAPVVVVRSSVVVYLPVREFATYSYNKYGSISLANEVLALLRSLVGIKLQELFAMNEVDIFGQIG